MTTDKWQWIKWDGNESFGSYSNGVQNITSLPLNYAAADRPLLSNIFSNSNLYDQYLAEVCDLTDTYFNSNFMDSLIESHKNLIQTSVFTDNNKMYTNANFTTNINSNITSGGGPMGGTTYGLKSFVSDKSAFVSNAINCSTILSTENIIVNTASLKPNPANNFTIINWENEAVQSIEIYNIIGSLVHQENVENYQTEKGVSVPKVL